MRNLFFTLACLLVGLHTALCQEGNKAVDQSSPPQPVKITLRCYSTHAPQSPLIIVDGVPVDSSGLRSVDPASIASIEILKPDASIALCGGAGAAGLILVTTRTGNSLNIIVQDSLDRLPLKAVSVMVNGKGSNKEYGLVTNEKGQARLPAALCRLACTMKISCVGYESKTASYDGKGMLAPVRLVRSRGLMDEVVVTGYSSMHKTQCSMMCTSLRSMVVKQDKETGDRSLSIYPNPYTGAGSLYITILQSLNGPMQVFNAAGQIVHFTHFQAKAGLPVTCSLPRLQAGAYFIQLTDRLTGTTYKTKLIVP